MFAIMLQIVHFVRETLENINTLDYFGVSDCPNIGIASPSYTTLFGRTIFVGYKLELPSVVRNLTDLEFLELERTF